MINYRNLESGELLPIEDRHFTDFLDEAVPFNYEPESILALEGDERIICRHMVDTAFTYLGPLASSYRDALAVLPEHQESDLYHVVDLKGSIHIHAGQYWDCMQIRDYSVPGTTIITHELYMQLSAIWNAA